MGNLFTPNRVAAYSLVLTAAGAFVSVVTGTLPVTWQATAVTIAGLLSHGAVVLKFMEGSQRHDQNQALIKSQQALPPATVGVPISYVPSSGLVAQTPDEAAAPESLPEYDPAQS